MGGLYRRVPHDRQRNADSNFQIGVSQGFFILAAGANRSWTIYR
jgi:hypothetical protein